MLLRAPAHARAGPAQHAAIPHLAVARAAPLSRRSPLLRRPLTTCVRASEEGRQPAGAAVQPPAVRRQRRSRAGGAAAAAPVPAASGSERSGGGGSVANNAWAAGAATAAGATLAGGTGSARAASTSAEPFKASAGGGIASSSGGSGDDGSGGRIQGNTLRLGVMRVKGPTSLSGTAALRSAYPQQAAAACASGQVQRIRMFSKTAGGSMEAHAPNLLQTRPPKRPVYACGATKMLKCLGAQLGDSLVLWAWPDGVAVAAALDETLPAFTLNASAFNSSRAAVDVPLGVAERLLGTDRARGLTRRVYVRVEGLGPQGSAEGDGLGGRLQGTPYFDGPRWQLVGLQPWLRSVGAEPGDLLQLGVRVWGGVGKRQAALTVALVKAADADGTLAVWQNGSCTEGGSSGVQASSVDLAGAVRVPYLMKVRDGALQGLDALRGAFAQQLDAAFATGQCDVRFLGRCPDGSVNPYSGRLARVNTSDHDVVLLRGVTSFVRDLGLQPGGAVALWLLPGGRVLMESVAGISGGAFMFLTERSFGGQCIAPISAVEALVGAERARPPRQRFPVSVAPDAAAPYADLLVKGACLRSGSQKRSGKPKWFLGGLKRWLDALEAAVGDELHFAVAEVAGPDQAPAAISVRLVRAGERVPDAGASTDAARDGAAGSDTAGNVDAPGGGGTQAARAVGLVRAYGAFIRGTALCDAFPVHATEARRGGRVSVELWGRISEGSLAPHSVTLLWRSRSILLQSVGPLLRQLGVAKGGRLLLSVLPDGRVVAEPAGMKAGG